MTRRLVLSSIALTVLILLALEIPLGLTASRQTRDELAVELERDATALGSFVEETLEGDENRDLQAIADNYTDDTGARVVIIDETGTAVADSAPTGEVERSFGSRPEVASALAGSVATGTRRSDTLNETLFYVAVPVASAGSVHGVVRLSYPTSEVDMLVRRTWGILLAVGVVSLTAATVIGWVLARWVTRPLRRLQASATALGGGDLSARAPTEDGPPEVRALALAFNDTAERLSDLVSAQDAFVADASHQLRTPLTALRLRLENLATTSEATDREDADAALDEVARLSRLVDGLLALARADRSGAPAPADPVDVADALRERVGVWTPVAEEQGLSLTVRSADGLRAVATPDRLSQVLDNLLANAIDAAPAGTTVSLEAEVEGPWAVIHVRDEGPGMSPPQLAQAFDRFWRSETGGRGTGLGLSIVQKLVRADAGEVTLHENPAGGLDARIRLRIAES